MVGRIECGKSSLAKSSIEHDGLEAVRLSSIVSLPAESPRRETLRRNWTGYLYIYLSYDNSAGMDVYFDELNIVYKESPVIQINAYYPFGLMAFNWTRIGEEKIKETFQGKELDEKTGWHDFQMRKYVGAIGRFLSQDPRNQFGSGYTSLGNNPVMGIDPDGEWVHLAVGAVIGGVVNWAMELSLIHKV